MTLETLAMRMNTLQQPLVAGIELDGLVDESRLAPANGLQDPLHLRGGVESVVLAVPGLLAARALAAASPVVALFCHTFENFNHFAYSLSSVSDFSAATLSVTDTKIIYFS